MHHRRTISALALFAILGCDRSTSTVAAPTTVKPEQPAARFVQRPAEVEGFVVATLPPTWRVGTATAGVTPIYDGLGVALQRDGLFLGSERMVAVSDGQLERSAIVSHLLVPLDEHLKVVLPALKTDYGDGFGHANLYVDPDMLVGDLVDVIYTLGRNEFFSYHFAVANGGDPIHLGFLVSPPIINKMVPEGFQLLELLVNITADGVQAGRRVDGQATTWEPLWPWAEQPMVQLERVATEFAAEHPHVGPKRPRIATFTAETQLPVARLFEAMNATSGRDCRYMDLWNFEGGDPRRCHFAERIFQAAMTPSTPASGHFVVSDSAESSSTRDRVRAIVRSHIGEVKVCYERGLARDPNLQGQIKVEFVIEADGRVSQAKIVESTLNDPDVENCLSEVTGTWLFEGLGNEGRLIITYPFNFKPNE